MGIGSFFKDQLSRIIEWKDQQSDILVWKFPSEYDEIKTASKLIISPGQGVILVYEGKVVAHFNEEGLFDLETDNDPFLTTFLKLRTNFESEHKLKIWFYRRAETVNQGWGTSQMIKYMDPVYKIPVELGANGTFSFRISNPLHLFSNVVGATDIYTVAEAQQLLQNRFPEKLSAVLAQSALSYYQIDAQLPALSDSIKAQLNTELDILGFELTDFKLNGTVFDQATKERIGKVADVTAGAMAAGEGGLTYVEMEKLKALRDAARNEGVMAGAGMQFGAGMDLGKTFNAAKEEQLSTSTSDPVTRLKQLKLLLDEGIITQDEFEEKKREWLDKL